jgi:hypothetical protein
MSITATALVRRVSGEDGEAVKWRVIRTCGLVLTCFLTYRTNAITTSLTKSSAPYKFSDHHKLTSTKLWRHSDQPNLPIAIYAHDRSPPGLQGALDCNSAILGTTSTSKGMLTPPSSSELDRTPQLMFRLLFQVSRRTMSSFYVESCCHHWWQPKTQHHADGQRTDQYSG